MRAMALDVGDKTIGVAVSDALGLAAHGLLTIQRVGVRKDTGRILELVRQQQVDTIVVGLPKRLDGSDSPQTEKVYEFTAKLKNKLTSNGCGKIPVVYQDERLTTKEAERILIDADLSRSRRKEVIDKQAAVLILQGYLASRPAAESENTGESHE